MQAKELNEGDKVRNAKNVWTVERVTRSKGMTYAIGTDAKGVQFALAKKDTWDVAIVQQ